MKDKEIYLKEKGKGQEDRSLGCLDLFPWAALSITASVGMKMKWRSFRSSSSCSSSNGDVWIHVLEVSVGRGTRVITVPASPWTWSWWIMDILKASKGRFITSKYFLVKLLQCCKIWDKMLIIMYNIWTVWIILIWFHVFFFIILKWFICVELWVYFLT